MKVSLRNGKLTMSLCKSEQKKLSDAELLSVTMGTLDPVDPAIKEHAQAAVGHLKALRSMCSVVEAPRPLLDTIPGEKEEVLLDTDGE